MSKGNYNIDLIKHMAVCDANYIRLLKLIPQLKFYRNQVMNSPHDRVLNIDDGSKVAGSNLIDAQKSLQGIKKEICVADVLDTGEAVTVELEVFETFKYTNTLKIIQKPELTELVKNPVMLVRVYHDASTAEVISSQGHSNFQSRYPEINPMMYHSDEKKQVNIFLGEWLSLCLDVGRSAVLPELVIKP